MSTLRISDAYRKNPMSLIEGGHEVTIIWEDGAKYVYDKVKKPSNYVSHIAKRTSKHGLMIEVRVGGSVVWKRNNAQETTKEWIDFLGA